jgi:hypothetical protein
MLRAVLRAFHKSFAELAIILLLRNVRTLTIGAPLKRKAKRMMRNASGILLALVLVSCASGEGPAKDIGRGAGDVGTGAAKAGGSAAKGTAKGAADVVTLHPIAGATSVGKGAAGAGKDVTVGTVRGTGKVVKGVGKVFKKVL